MAKVKWIVLMILVLCTAAHAADKKPTEKSIKELLRVVESQKLIEASIGQFDGFMRSAMQQALDAQELTAEQQEEIVTTQAKMVALFKKEMNWEKLEPVFIRIYSESFSQKEVDGMLAFYKSDPGQAVIKKMPIVMQNTMREMQKIMGPVMQKAAEMQKEKIAEITSGGSKEKETRP